MYRLVALAGIAVASSTAGCSSKPEPVAPLTQVADARGIRVYLAPLPLGTNLDALRLPRLRAEAGEAIDDFDRALADTLRRAGYELSAGEGSLYDVRLYRAVYLEGEAREKRHGRMSVSGIRRVIVLLYDGENEIDRLTFVAPEGEAPASQPERVAVDLVNAMNQSLTVGRWAAERRRGNAADASAR